MLIEAIILDFDGVLCDSQSIHKSCFIDALKIKGYDWCKKKEAIYSKNKEKKTSYKLMLLEKSKLISLKDIESIESKKQELTLEKIKKSKIEERVFEFLLKAKQKGLKLGIASDANKNSILSFLDANFAIELFDVITTSSDVLGEVKPSPKVYELCVKKLKVDPKNSIAFDDSKNGILAARLANINLACYCTYNTLYDTLKDIILKDIDNENSGSLVRS